MRASNGEDDGDAGTYRMAAISCSVVVLVHASGELAGVTMSCMLRLLAEGVLVVVHPDLEDVALDVDLVAELLHGGLVVLLDAPAHALRERQHPVLLLLGELGAEPLFAGPGPARAGGPGAQGHAAERAQSRHGPGHPGQVVAVVASAVGCGRQRQGPRSSGGGGHVVRVRLVVVEVAGRGAVVRGELLVRCGPVCDDRGGGHGRAAALAGGGLLAVEVAVAVARSAPERVEGALLARGHELAAAVHGVAADAHGVVPEALAVRPAPATTAGAARGLGAAADGLARQRLISRRHAAATEPGRLRRRLVAGAQHGRQRGHLLVAVIVVVELHGKQGRRLLCLGCSSFGRRGG
jgi:hypothetical protein